MFSEEAPGKDECRQQVGAAGQGQTESWNVVPDDKSRELTQELRPEASEESCQNLSKNFGQTLNEKPVQNSNQIVFTQPDQNVGQQPQQQSQYRQQFYSQQPPQPRQDHSIHLVKIVQPLSELQCQEPQPKQQSEQKLLPEMLLNSQPNVGFNEATTTSNSNRTANQVQSQSEPYSPLSKEQVIFWAYKLGVTPSELQLLSNEELERSVESTLRAKYIGMDKVFYHKKLRKVKDTLQWQRAGKNIGHIYGNRVFPFFCDADCPLSSSLSTLDGSDSVSQLQASAAVSTPLQPNSKSNVHEFAATVGMPAIAVHLVDGYQLDVLNGAQEQQSSTAPEESQQGAQNKYKVDKIRLVHGCAVPRQTGGIHNQVCTSPDFECKHEPAAHTHSKSQDVACPIIPCPATSRPPVPPCEIVASTSAKAAAASTTPQDGRPLLVRSYTDYMMEYNKEFIKEDVQSIVITQIDDVSGFVEACSRSYNTPRALGFDHDSKLSNSGCIPNPSTSQADYLAARARHDARCAANMPAPQPPNPPPMGMPTKTFHCDGGTGSKSQQQTPAANKGAFCSSAAGMSAAAAAAFATRDNEKRIAAYRQAAQKQLQKQELSSLRSCKTTDSAQLPCQPSQPSQQQKTTTTTQNDCHHSTYTNCDLNQSQLQQQLQQEMLKYSKYAEMCKKGACRSSCSNEAADQQ